MKARGVEADDGIQFHEEVRIDAYQSGALVSDTRRLAELTRTCSDQFQLACIARAVIVVAAAALEALLSEAAYLTKRTLYDDKKFRKAGVPEKFKKFMKRSSDDAERLWEYRNALTHAEPDNRRTRFVGEIINEVGALWVASTVEQLAVEVWQDQMPPWFREMTELHPRK